jgi:ketosteroid isomerase-like protein
MTPTQTPVTGREELTDLSQPQQALAQFYRAFNSRDLELMKQNWLQTEEAAMDNPLGGIKRGWREIEPVYRSVFEGSATVLVEFFDYTLHVAEGFFYVVGRERGELRTADGTRLELKIRTSRLFRKSEKTWKQVHHHGSIDDPDLLKQYQSLVLGPAKT